MTDSTRPSSDDQQNDSYEESGAKEVESTEVQQALKKLAENKPEKFVEIMAMEMSSAGNPLHHKMTQEHISQVLDLAAKHDERLYNLHTTSQNNDFLEGKSNRAYCFSAFVLVLALTTIILFLFREKPEVLIPVLSGLGGLISGFLAGWGFGTRQK